MKKLPTTSLLPLPAIARNRSHTAPTPTARISLTGLVHTHTHTHTHTQRSSRYVCILLLLVLLNCIPQLAVAQMESITYQYGLFYGPGANASKNEIITHFQLNGHNYLSVVGSQYPIASEPYLNISIVEEPSTDIPTGLKVPKVYHFDLSDKFTNPIQVVDVDFLDNGRILITASHRSTHWDIVYIFADLNDLAGGPLINSVHRVEFTSPQNIIPTSTEVVGDFVYSCGFLFNGFVYPVPEPDMKTLKESFVSRWNSSASTATLNTFGSWGANGLINDYDMFLKIKYINNRLIVMGSCNNGISNTNANYAKGLNADVNLTTLALSNIQTITPLTLPPNGNDYFSGVVCRDLIADPFNAGTFYSLLSNKTISGPNTNWEIAAAHLDNNLRLSLPALPSSPNMIKFPASFGDASLLGYQMHPYVINNQLQVTITGVGEQESFGATLPLSIWSYMSYNGVTGMAGAELGRTWKPNLPGEDPNLTLIDQGWFPGMPILTNPPSATKITPIGSSPIEIVQSGHWLYYTESRVRVLAMNQRGYNDCIVEDNKKYSLVRYQDGTIALSPALLSTNVTHYGEKENWKLANQSLTCTGEWNSSKMTPSRLASISSTLSTSIYPNPTSSSFTVTSKSIMQQVVVLDAQGKIVKQVKVGNTLCAIDCSQFSKGIYWVEATLSNGRVERQKVIVQ